MSDTATTTETLATTKVEGDAADKGTVEKSTTETKATTTLATAAVEKVDGKETKGEAGKETKAEVKDTKAPVDFELKTPDGSGFSKEQLGGFKKFATEKGLNGEQAQAAVDWYAKVRAEEAKSFDAEVAETNKKNIAAVQADKELGGANFEQTKLLLQKAGAKYWPPGSVFASLLESTGAGNHPEVIRTLVRIGRDMAEDTVARGSTKAKPKPASPIQYPSMRKES